MDDFDVQVEDAKLEYLKTAKSGLMQHAGLGDVSTEDLQAMIQSKLRLNYIYKMSYCAKHNVTKFSIIIEISRKDGHPFRLMAALEYRPDDKVVRLVTFY